MQLHLGVETLQPEWVRSVACVGTFDGVHLGHRQVIGSAVEAARAAELPSVLVTFDRHPAAVLAPERCPAAIRSLGDNLEIIASLGISDAVVLRFDAELSRMSADRFLSQILVGAIRAEQLVVGHDFAMGQNRQGTPEWLAEHIATEVVPPFAVDGERVSSSAIRALVAAGDMAGATRWLGQPFAISGTVVAGQKLGRQLGFPTANIARSIDQVLPPDGVYAGRLRLDGREWGAACSIGMRPTVSGTSRSIEAYLLDYEGLNFYGRDVRLDVTHRLRDELNLPDLETLTTQIGRDVEQVRALLRA